MPLNLASPGIVIREVDLTIGRVDPTSGSTGALVAPFANGATSAPVDPLVGSTLPMVKSTSLITIPGDAKFRGIFYTPNLRFFL